MQFLYQAEVQTAARYDILARVDEEMIMKWTSNENILLKCNVPLVRKRNFIAEPIAENRCKTTRLINLVSK